MKRLQAFKFRLQPNGAQIRQMQQFAGNARRIWNLALARQKSEYELGNKFTASFGMNAWLIEWKKEYEYLKKSPAQTLQQVTKDLQAAFKHFFEKRADFPTFKKKDFSNSFRFPQGCHLEQPHSRIFLPKLGWIRYRNSQKVLGTIKNVTLSQTNNHWFMSIQTERELEVPQVVASSAIGIDVGITRFATLSDATYLEPLNSFKKKQEALARYQRRMSKKKKFSNNWKKAKAQVQKIHTAIANSRKDFLHKASTIISKNHALVCVEDLQIKNMSKSAKGNLETPGNKVKQKSGLNRAILDQGWGEFRRQLRYKMAWNGGLLVAVPAKNTSRTCPCCGHISEENRQTQAQFLCMACHYENNADVVGAINVLERGHRLLACGEMTLLGRSMNQEPTEAIQALCA